MKPALAVGAVILTDTAVLLVRRGQKPLAGTWSLPGGKVEPDEPLAAAISREVREETGLSVEPGPCLDVVTVAGEGFAYEIHEFLCRVTGGSLRAGDDAAEAAWVAFGELSALGVTDAVRALVDAGRGRAGGAALAHHPR